MRKKKRLFPLICAPPQLTTEKAKLLRSRHAGGLKRKVILAPDSGGYTIWLWWVGDGCFLAKPSLIRIFQRRLHDGLKTVVENGGCSRRGDPVVEYDQI